MKEFKLIEAKADVEKLIRYIPWLEQKRGTSVSHNYENGEASKSTMTFPVYDSTLMSFINEARDTMLVYENYPYVYTEKAIRSIEDELKVIEEATVPTAGYVRAIFSRYILKGMTKGVVWQEAVTEGIFVECLYKFKKLLEIWDAPLA